MDLWEAIRNRRSVRIYRPDPVSDEQLVALVEAACLAPSWANVQPWEFIAVRDAGTKEKLAALLTPKNPALRAVREAPVVLAACVRKKLSGFYKGLAITSLGDYGLFDLGLAMQNLTLAAHAAGLATLHVGALDLDGAARLLGVPDEIQLVELVPLGYPDGKAFGPPRKRPEEVLHRERFGSR